MLERLKSISTYHNVSGCESKIRSFIQSEMEKSHLNAVIDETNCIYTTRNSLNSARTIFISVPMDVPGFLTLFLDQKKACLVSTGSFPFKLKKDQTLIGEDNKILEAKMTGEDSSEFEIPSKSVNLGDSFRIPPALEQNNRKISGYFSVNYALIALLLDLLSHQTNHNVIFCFAQGNATNSAKQKNVIRRTNPDFAVFLSTFTSDSKTPCILLRDGKSFSDTELVSQVLKTAKDLKIKLKKEISDTSISKAEAVFASEALPFVSLSIPHTQLKNGKISFDLQVYEELLLLLKSWL